ncbi:hypothetical protein PC110_g14638 [Phytophthora cactorum]|uniref:Uncharacterized protein n=1 Tax=Phytophthora cactorum TaxID=29920 RepID=A0A329RZZ7_9STRA|nr:hypothetical protein PC110_g14638 [Phytophthora cactorum]
MQEGPASVAVIKDLRRKVDGILTAKEKVVQIMTDHVEVLPPPPPNTEKKSQMYYSIRPYVPVGFQNDPLYAKPTEQEGESCESKTCSSSCYGDGCQEEPRTTWNSSGRPRGKTFGKGQEEANTKEERGHK